jgi:hypothetical protein
MHVGIILLIALIILVCLGPGAILRALVGLGCLVVLAAVPALTPTPTSVQLDLQSREDSIAALQALGFKKREAQSRVNAVTTGSSTEEIIKAALL